MSCRRAFEIDLAGFLEDPRADAFADFRDHYPRCPECSVEVGAWSELEAQLRARNDARHPDPQQLARFPEGLDARERVGVERHLVDCAACRDELRALEAFAPGSLPGAGAPRRAKGGGRLRTGWASLGRLAWSPGFAYAALALVLLPTIYDALDSAPELLSDSSSPSVQSEMDVPVRVDKDDVEPRRSVARKPAVPPPARELADPKLESVREKQEAAPESEELAPAVMLRKRAIESPALEAMAEPIPAAALELDEVEARAADAGSAYRVPPRPALRDSPVAAYAAPALREESRADASKVHYLSASRAFRGSLPAPVQLSPDAPAQINAAIASRGFRLAAPLPRGLAPGEIEIRVSDAASRRELRERVRVASGQTQVELEIPANWMGQGIYRVTIHDSRGSGDDTPLAVYVLWLVGHAP